MDIFTIPGRRFQPDVALLRAKLVRTIKAKQGFAITDLFRYIRLTNDNQILQEKLSKRGSFIYDEASTIYRNRGRSIFHIIKDLLPGVNRIECSIPRILKFESSLLSEDSLRLTLAQSPIRISIPATRQMGYSGQFELRAINLLTAGSEFVLTEKVLNGVPKQIKFLVDFSLKSFVPFRPKNLAPKDTVLLNPANLFKINTFSSFDLQGDPCFCCAPRRRRRPLPSPNPNPNRNICARILIKVLFEPIRDILNMIQTLQEIYSSYNIDIQLVHIERINDPTLLDVDIGQCVRNQTPTEDQDTLFNNRNFAQANDIVIYFVRSTIPATLGCAADPVGRPGAIVTRNATLFTLAHEIGHVLDLNHVNNSDRLMTGGGTSNITNPPPDLVQSEINTIRASNLTKNC